MALVLADRVLETTSVAGTGDASLSGAIVGYQPFSVIGGGNTTYYTIVAIDDNGAPTGDWEVGIGTYVTSGNKISRDTVLSSSNGGALVYFASGNKQIFLDLPSEELPVASGDVTGPASAVANNFAAFNLTTGKLIKDSGYNASSFATAAQGTLADTAIQPGDLGTAAYLDAGSALGVATLDAGGKVPTSQIPQMGDLNYQGTWNASTNTPTLTSSAGTKGFYYVVSVAGSTNLNGITDWKVGDWAVFNGSVWEKIDNTDAVTSVNGYTGTVVLTNTDISGFGTMSTQNANSVAITGGAIDGTTIGATTPSSSKFTTALVGSNANFTDFPNAQAVFSQANTGSGHIYNMGLAGEGVATDVPGAGQWGVGVYGTGATAGATRGIGVVGDGHVGNTADTAAAIGVRGYSTNTHSGGQNIGLYSQATGGASNYSLFMASGNIYSAVTQTWAVPDNETAALSLDTTGKAGILRIVTTNAAEKVTMSGGLDVTGTTTLATSLSGLAKLTSGVVSAATSGTDYAPATSGTSILYGNGSGGFSNVTIGTGVSFAGGTLSATGSGGTVTSVAATAGTGISVTGSPITSSGTLTITNTAPDQTVAITGAGGAVVTGTYPNFTITTPSGTVTSVSGTAPVVSSGGATPAISMAAANTSTNGYLTSTDWNTFNGKGSGTVTSVGGTGTVNGITLTGTVTSSGNLTLGGTLGGIGNSQLTNSAVTIGSTSVSLGATATTLAGLTSVTSTTVVASGVVGSSATGALTMPSGTTAERPGSPTTGMVRYNTTNGAVEYYNGSAWYSVASVPPPSTIAHLIIAGGGGAGDAASGGGGAGGVLYNASFAVSAGVPLTVTVGAGGAGATGAVASGNGSNSVFSTSTATGGGGGGSNQFDLVGHSGGSGGGGASNNSGSGGAGGAGTSGQGSAGGSGAGSAGGYPNISGGGGGGASAVGGNASTGTPGNGGAGTNAYSAWATATSTGVSGYYAGGGGGGSCGAAISTGGAGGGGAGNNSTGLGVAGTANTGSGAGSSLATGPQRSGGSGIVIIRYPNTYSTAASTTGSPTLVNSGGYYYYTWTGSGSITF